MEPQSCMNPLLLKSKDNGELTVYLHGRPLEKEQAAYYFTHRQELLREIIRDFNRLRETCDIICIEGAGSPAEPNLQERDVANMGFAREVGAPVLLVGDIERGGVFASLYGTLMLLPELDRRLVKGFLINKFDGERKYLEPAPAILEKKTGVPVLGVIPKLSVALEEEDISFSASKAVPLPDEEESFCQISSALRTHLQVTEILDLFNHSF